MNKLDPPEIWFAVTGQVFIHEVLVMEASPTRVLLDGYSNTLPRVPKKVDSTRHAYFPTEAEALQFLADLFQDRIADLEKEKDKIQAKIDADQVSHGRILHVLNTPGVKNTIIFRRRNSDNPDILV